MPAASGDDTAGAGNDTAVPSSAERSIMVTGNRIDSRDLFSNERELIISHGDDVYRLRLTSQHKLILTK